VEQFRLDQERLHFRTVCKKNGIDLSDAQLNKLEEYVSLLLQSNKSLNLISRKDEENVWQNHILHSIAPAFKLSFHTVKTLLDLGTGAGLPGIPLKILFPELYITLLDSIRKKIHAVEGILSALGLKGISAVCGRAEDLSKMGISSFDAVISRAVTGLEKLVRWSYPLLRRNDDALQKRFPTLIRIPPGTLIVYKGGNIEKEIGRARRFPKLRSIVEIPLVFYGSENVFFVDKKIVLIQFSP
jgi:16S rRNA (guanine(527)-N(7))-methyltransferase RsmG